MRLINQIFAIFCLMFVFEAFGQTSENQKEKVYKIIAINSKKVLEASAGTKGKVQLWKDLKGSNEYVYGAKNQLWRVNYVNNNTACKFENVHFKGMVLDASAGNKGMVQLWNDLENSSKYVPYAKNQKWEINNRRGNEANLVNKHFSNHILTGMTDSSVKLRPQSPNSIESRKWKLVPVMIERLPNRYQYETVLTFKTGEDDLRDLGRLDVIVMKKNKFFTTTRFKNVNNKKQWDSHSNKEIKRIFTDDIPHNIIVSPSLNSGDGLFSQRDKWDLKELRVRIYNLKTNKLVYDYVFKNAGKNINTFFANTERNGRYHFDIPVRFSMETNRFVRDSDKQSLFN